MSSSENQWHWAARLVGFWNPGNLNASEELMNGFRLRYLGPMVLITLCLVALCAFTATSLLTQQTTITELLRENVESQRAAVELEECLTDLIALENDRVEKVSVLHDRVQVLLHSIREVADQPEEKRLASRLETGYTAYLQRWRTMPPLSHPRHEDARKKATRMLQTGVLEPCQELKLYNADRIEASAENHERGLKQLGWGLAAVGGLGAIAGVVLGYAVASELSRTIRRLQVHVRDAVGKLDPKHAEIVLTGQGDFGALQADLEQLSGRIEGIISALQQREREVLRAEQLAAVGQLAAGVAHEIRNPLTSIKMLVQAGLEDLPGQPVGLAADDLRVIEGEVRRMERSLQIFLDFARPSVPEKRPTVLVPLLRGVADLIHGRAEKQRVKVQIVAQEEPQAVVDGEQIRQVLVNLCLNALDMMPTGGTLTITVRATPTSVEIEVTDTGPGIPEKVLPQLFQPFVSTKDTGLGLGLVISRRILEDHGGWITARNRPEGGARFLVILPAEHGV